MSPKAVSTSTGLLFLSLDPSSVRSRALARLRNSAWTGATVSVLLAPGSFASKHAPRLGC